MNNALEPSMPPAAMARTVVARLRLFDSGPFQLEGSVSAREATGTVILAGDARQAAPYANI
jgi:hypothetical protein